MWEFLYLLNNLNYQDNQLLIIGIIHGPWGIKGFVKFTPYVNDITIFEINNNLYVDATETTLVDVVIQNNKRFLKFNNINNRDDAEKLNGKQITIYSSDYPDVTLNNIADSHIGMNVEASSQIIGIISEIIKTGANDVYLVKTKDGELLVPVIDDFIQSIDNKNNKVIIKNKKGL